VYFWDYDFTSTGHRPITNKPLNIEYERNPSNTLRASEAIRKKKDGISEVLKTCKSLNFDICYFPDGVAFSCTDMKK
jgi:hypothetical protein